MPPTSLTTRSSGLASAIEGQWSSDWVRSPLAARRKHPARALASGLGFYELRAPPGELSPLARRTGSYVARVAAWLERSGDVRVGALKAIDAASAGPVRRLMRYGSTGSTHTHSKPCSETCRPVIATYRRPQKQEVVVFRQMLEFPSPIGKGHIENLTP